MMVHGRTEMHVKHPYGVMTQVAEGAAHEVLPPFIVVDSVQPRQIDLVELLKEQNAQLLAQLRAEQEKKQQLERECLDLSELNYELLKVVSETQMKQQEIDIKHRNVKASKYYDESEETRPKSPQHPKTNDPSSPTQTSPTQFSASPQSGSPPATTVLKLPYPTTREDGSPKKSTSFLGAFWSKAASEPELSSVCSNRRRRFGSGSSNAKRALHFSVSESELPGANAQGDEERVKRVLAEGERDPKHRSVSL
jgi:hypothetical protein